MEGGEEGAAEGAEGRGCARRQTRRADGTSWGVAPAQPGEGHDGRVKVQLLIGEIFTYSKPSNLFEVTPERRAGLSDKEKASLALYEKCNEKCLGVDFAAGGRVYSTR